MADSKRSLVGNRLVLIGAVVYPLEWVPIIAAHATQPLGRRVHRGRGGIDLHREHGRVRLGRRLVQRGVARPHPAHDRLA